MSAAVRAWCEEVTIPTYGIGEPNRNPMFLENRVYQATERFHNLVSYGRQHMDDQPEIDFFAVSLPDFLVSEDSLSRRNQIHCHFMIALGMAGLGEVEAVRQHFQSLAALDPSHVGPMLYPKWLGWDESLTGTN